MSHFCISLLGCSSFHVIHVSSVLCLSIAVLSLSVLCFFFSLSLSPSFLSLSLSYNLSISFLYPTVHLSLSVSPALCFISLSLPSSHILAPAGGCENGLIMYDQLIKAHRKRRARLRSFTLPSAERQVPGGSRRRKKRGRGIRECRGSWPIRHGDLPGSLMATGSVPLLALGDR